MRIIYVFFLVWCVSGSAFGGAKVDSIRGGDQVKVLNSKGEHWVKQGSELRPGDRLDTEGVSGAKIIFEDGSIVAIGPNSQFLIESDSDVPHSVRLKKGSLRGLISKINQKKRKLRYVFKTRNAVMGVRGTEFVIEQGAGGASEFHLLEGKVDLAKNKKDLLSGKVRALRGGQRLQAIKGKLNPPRKFDVKKFIGDFEKKTPGMKIGNRFRERARSGEKNLRQKFRQDFRGKVGNRGGVRRPRGMNRKRPPNTDRERFKKHPPHLKPPPHHP